MHAILKNRKALALAAWAFQPKPYHKASIEACRKIKAKVV